MIKMELHELKSQVKQMALDGGAKFVGIGTRERLKDAPPSGNMDYLLPGAQSCIIWVFTFSFEALRAFFAKDDRMGIKKEEWRAYSGSWQIANEIADFIENNTEFKAHAIIPNGQYRKGMGMGAEGLKGRLRMWFGGKILKREVLGNVVTKSIAKTLGKQMIFPPFSLRYGAVAAGLGRIGWSGNVVTEQAGGACLFGGILTTAPLEADPLAEESNCNKCKLCATVCNSGFFSSTEAEDPVIIGGRKEIYSKRNIWGRCGIGCGGLTGLSKDGEWSIWSPNHVSLAKVPEEQMSDLDYIQDLLKKLMYSKETPEENRKYTRYTLAEFTQGGLFKNVGERSLEMTNPRCGFCSLICVEDFEQRKELYQILKNSGKMFVDDEVQEFVWKQGESGEKTKFYPPTNIE